MKRGAGLYLLFILVAALLVAWLAVSQMGALRPSVSTDNGTEQSADPVEQAQEAVDAINDMQQSAGQEP